MISLGNIIATHQPCELNLTALLETRMLVQANSGGGKSYALRRLLEQTAPSVQQLVIDPEGEFASLREKFDYVIAAPADGDALATPQTATLLARRLLESGVSAILNIYELKAHERVLFVRRFFEALVNAPKALWHPVLIVLDEAHVYAPQVGSAESLQAVSDIATRGRKRGQCLIAATQRLSKLHKDVAAELGNKMIGRTGLDVDVKRAADELGFSSRDATDSLRNLEAGEFFVFGPALARTVEKVKVGQVQTTHPKAGHRTMEAPPAPSAKVRAQLAKLADLQKEAESELRTIEEFRAENAKLKREATVANKRAEKAGVPEAEVQRRIAEALKHRDSAGNNSRNNLRADSSRKVLERIAAIVNKELESTGSQAALPAATDPVRTAPLPERVVRPAAAVASAAGVTGLSTAQQRILDVLAQLAMYGIDAPPREMIAAHAGVSPTSGGFFNNLGRLRSLGYVDYPAGGMVTLTDSGNAIATQPSRAPTLDELHQGWLNILPAAQRAILEALIVNYPNAISRDALADHLNVSRTSGGYFNNLGRLRTMGAIDYPSKGFARAADILFPERRK